MCIMPLPSVTACWLEQAVMYVVCAEMILVIMGIRVRHFCFLRVFFLHYETSWWEFRAMIYIVRTLPYTEAAALSNSAVGQLGFRRTNIFFFILR